MVKLLACPIAMPNSSRHLAAIMFTDIAGYTAIMGESEDKAFDLLEKNRGIQRPLIEEFNGEVLKEMGDGILASFDSTRDAVQCAIRIQEASFDIPDLQLKIGIHLGDITFRDNDVFGDGVNIASRLQAEAEPCQILVSSAVYESIRNQDFVSANFLRDTELKNVPEPVRIYEITTSVESAPVKSQPVRRKRYGWYLMTAVVVILAVVAYLFLPGIADAGETREPGEINIAVLPFRDISEGGDQQYFADGVMEDINTALYKLGIIYRPRSTVEIYRDENTSFKQIGRELEVEFIIAASLRKTDSEIKITVEYIRAEDGAILHRENFTADYSMGGLSTIQKALAEKVVSEFKINVTPEEIELVVEQPTDNMMAYEHVKKGWEYYTDAGLDIFKNIDDRIEKYNFAIYLAKAAIKEDSNYVDAYKLLAHAYSQFKPAIIEVPGNWDDSTNIAAMKGIKLDSACASCYTAMAKYNGNDSLKAYYYTKAAEYDPLNFMPNQLAHLYSGNLYVVNRWEQIIGIIDASRTYNSESKWYQMRTLANLYYRSGNRKEAKKYLKMFEAGLELPRLNERVNVRWLYLPLLNEAFDQQEFELGDWIVDRYCTEFDDCDAEYFKRFYRSFYSYEFTEMVEQDRADSRHRDNMDWEEYTMLLYSYWRTGAADELDYLITNDMSTRFPGIFQELQKAPEERNIGRTGHLILYSHIAILENDNALALQYLRRAVEADYLIDISYDVFFETLRSNPEFIELAEIQAERRAKVAAMIAEKNFPSAYELATTHANPELRIPEGSIPK